VTNDARLREYDAGVLPGIIWVEVEFLYPDVWGHITRPVVGEHLWQEDARSGLRLAQFLDEIRDGTRTRPRQR
jgi:hypothetical protein